MEYAIGVIIFLVLASGIIMFFQFNTSLKDAKSRIETLESQKKLLEDECRKLLVYKGGIIQSQIGDEFQMNYFGVEPVINLTDVRDMIKLRIQEYFLTSYEYYWEKIDAGYNYLLNNTILTTGTIHISPYDCRMKIIEPMVHSVLNDPFYDDKTFYHIVSSLPKS